ncbi:MAG: hypothetical protein ACOYJJ_05530 [Anaerovoracaceae bacterium]|jgi:hypothetical protein
MISNRKEQQDQMDTGSRMDPGSKTDPGSQADPGSQTDPGSQMDPSRHTDPGSRKINTLIFVISILLASVVFAGDRAGRPAVEYGAAVCFFTFELVAFFQRRRTKWKKTVLVALLSAALCTVAAASILSAVLSGGGGAFLSGIGPAVTGVYLAGIELPFFLLVRTEKSSRVNCAWIVLASLVILIAACWIFAEL